jgi:hypothetical protein
LNQSSDVLPRSETYFRHVDFADAFHPLFSFFLFLQQFAFAVMSPP